MEIREEDIMQIEAYLKDQISLEEARQQVEGFDEKLELYRQSLAAIETWSDKQLKEKLMASYQPAARRPLWASQTTRILSIAATIVVLLGLFFLLRPKPEGFDASRLFAASYEKPELPVSLVRGGNNADSLLREAAQLYELGRYEACLQATQELQADSLADQNDLYALSAYAAMQLGKWPDAAASLSKISNAYPAYNESRWYLALVALKLEDIETSRNELSYLQANSREFGKRAEQLLKNLPQK